VLVASTGALAESFEVTGSCRDGLPNGNYELRMPDGSLRVVGAFAHGRKTGTFIFWTDSGARIAVIPYDEDARSGTVALWYVAPEARIEKGRRLEAPYVADRLHGVVRSWYPNGVPRGQYRYEHGQLVDVRAWTDAASVLPDAEAASSALREAEADQRFVDDLLAMVYRHPPHCD
jgi:antitoxin component YwqK of YwqJK toxin-antitoxin module